MCIRDSIHPLWETHLDIVEIINDLIVNEKKDILESLEPYADNINNHIIHLRSGEVFNDRIKIFTTNQIEEIESALEFDYLTELRTVVIFMEESVYRRISYHTKHTGIFTNELFDKVIEDIDYFMYYLLAGFNININYTPNMKYPIKMFKRTQELINSGYSQKVSGEKTLEEYSMNISKRDSYLRQFRDRYYLKKIIPSKMED